MKHQHDRKNLPTWLSEASKSLATEAEAKGLTHYEINLRVLEVEYGEKYSPSLVLCLYVYNLKTPKPEVETVNMEVSFQTLNTIDSTENLFAHTAQQMVNMILDLLNKGESNAKVQ